MNKYIKEILKKLEIKNRINFYSEVGEPFIIKRNITSRNTNVFEVHEVLVENSAYCYGWDELEEYLNKCYYNTRDEDKDIKPAYYQCREISCKQLQEQFEYKDKTDIPNIVPYYENNILKYLYRYRFKNGIEDLKKARTYINFLISLSKTADGREDKDE